MTITTNNKNPKNDSQYARHRSVWKGQTSVLDSVLTNLRGAQYVTYLAPLITALRAKCAACGGLISAQACLPMSQA
jgi:hypothetical protein